MTGFEQRRRRVLQWMQEEELGAMLVSAPENVRWLTGSSCEGLLVIDEEGPLICTDSRYAVAAAEEAPDVQAAAEGNHLQQAIERLADGQARRVGFEASHLTYASYSKLADALDGAEIVPCEDQLRVMRMVKDADEVELIRRAARIADEAFARWREELVPGFTEREAALELHRLMVLAGAERPSFEIIVASGPNGAKPHARPGAREIGEGELVVVDWGALVEGYCSDCTRTVILGEPDARAREVWEAVREAQQAALDGLSAGIKCMEVDAIARDLLRERGWESEFGHGLGHGVGLAVHEGPTLGPRSTEMLQPAMVVTIEPGVYIEGWGGVRLEELVLVTEEGGTALTQAPYDL